MTTPSPFPANFMAIIEGLERRIKVLETQAGQLKGAPVTKASSAFFIPSASSSTPSGGVQLRMSGSQLVVDQPDGESITVQEPPQIPRAAAVSSISGTPGSAPSSYSQSYMQSIRDQLDEIRTFAHACRDTEEAAGLRVPD